MPGWLTLIGSGETAAGMAKVHRALLGGLATPPRPVFLDTPAGFELGAEAIAARFASYFAQRFNLNLAVASHRRADDDPGAQAAALQAVARSNYILAGPGSPTYAAQEWKRSQVFQAVIDRWLAGAQLVFASSAAIAIGRHVLPVYEIYKAGRELHWVEGLDLLGPCGYELAIATHWDNAEGGTHDTRACFMGMERFERLRLMLPPQAVVLGVDEHTACTLDLESGTARVQGRGGVTILRACGESRHAAGDTFSLAELSPAGQAAPAIPARVAEREAASEDRPGATQQPARAIERVRPCVDPEAPLLQVLVDLRAALRAARQWALADQVRQRLGELGYEIRDTPEGTVWEKKEPSREL